MFKANPNIIRSNYIWNIIKNIISEKWYTITEVADKIWITQPALSRALNWSVVWSDNLFSKIMKWTNISDKEIKNIFKKADQEEYKYRYWEDIDPNALEDIDFDVMLSREYWINDKDAIKDVKKYIEFIKNK